MRQTTKIGSHTSNMRIEFFYSYAYCQVQLSFIHLIWVLTFRNTAAVVLFGVDVT